MTISNKSILFFMAAMLSLGFDVYGMDAKQQTQQPQLARPSSAPTVKGAKEQKLAQSDSKLSQKSRVAIPRDLVTPPAGKVSEVLISVDTNTSLDYHVRAGDEQQKSSRSYRILLEKIIAEFSEKIKKQSESDLQKNFAQELENLQAQIDVLKISYEQILVFIKIEKTKEAKSYRLVYTLKPRKNDEKTTIPLAQKSDEKTQKQFEPKSLAELIAAKTPNETIMVCLSYDVVYVPKEITELFIFIDTQQQELLVQKRLMLEGFTSRLLDTLKELNKLPLEQMQGDFVKALETFQKNIDSLKISYKQIKFLMKVTDDKSRWEYTLEPRKIQCRNLKPYAIGALVGITGLLVAQQVWALSQQPQAIGYWDYYWNYCRDYILGLIGLNS